MVARSTPANTRRRRHKRLNASRRDKASCSFACLIFILCTTVVSRDQARQGAALIVRMEAFQFLTDGGGELPAKTVSGEKGRALPVILSRNRAFLCNER